MYNEKIIDNVRILDDKIVLYYESGRIREIKEKAVVLYTNNNKFSHRYKVNAINEYIQLLKDYKKEKNKLTFNKFMKILKLNNNSYYDFKYTRLNGQAGYTYVLSKKMNMEVFNCFDNIRIGIRQCVQAPEIQNNIIFIQGV